MIACKAKVIMKTLHSCQPARHVKTPDIFCYFFPFGRSFPLRFLYLIVRSKVEAGGHNLKASEFNTYNGIMTEAWD